MKIVKYFLKYMGKIVGVGAGAYNNRLASQHC
jgi:hypothetical protein